MNAARRSLVVLTKHARNLRRICGAIERRIVQSVLVAQLCCLFIVPVAAQEVSREQLQGLDEQVQEIKADVLGIAAELTLLEEQLLYPSNTQLAVFVALAEGEAFRLDAVEIQIDGAPVARHVYSWKELESLQKGGVQRIYTGNVATGEHRLVVTLAGKLPSGSELSTTESFTFEKGVEPKLLELTLADGDGGEATVRLGGL